MRDHEDDEVRFVPATSRDLPVVLGLLDRAAAWLRTRNIVQWPASFDPQWVIPDLERGFTWLVTSGGRPAATVTMDWHDPLWDDLPRPAGYLHRMAVERWAAGAGRSILDWAGDQAARRDADAVRLDCVAGNRPLRAYYESAGFVHRGDTDVGGAPGQRADSADRTVVSRYERLR